MHDDEITEIDRLIKGHLEEVENLRSLKSELMRVRAKLDAYLQSSTPKLAAALEKRLPIQGTLQVSKRISNKTELVKGALAEPFKLWQTSSEIAQHISTEIGSEVKTNLISPVLSDLKNSGVIVRDGAVVALMKRVKNEEPEKVS